MRLSPKEIAAIKRTFYSVDPQAKVYLFGSRIDDTAKGGDIDLLVLSDKIDLDKKLAIKLSLYDQMGEQKIDIVLPDENNQVFINAVIAEAILL